MWECRRGKIPGSWKTGRSFRMKGAKLKFFQEKSCGLVPTQVQILSPTLHSTVTDLARFLG